MNSSENIIDDFSYYHFSSVTNHLREIVKISGQPNLNTDLVKSLSFGLSPLKEQKAIADYIETETACIDAKIAKTKRIIELQKEYRTALISEAVTGKIKVPELAT